jgi:hypothetical protein
LHAVTISRIGFDKFEQLPQDSGAISVIVGHVKEGQKPELGLYLSLFHMDMYGLARVPSLE